MAVAVLSSYDISVLRAPFHLLASFYLVESGYALSVNEFAALLMLLSPISYYCFLWFHVFVVAQSYKKYWVVPYCCCRLLPCWFWRKGANLIEERTSKKGHNFRAERNKPPGRPIVVHPTHPKSIPTPALSFHYFFSLLSLEFRVVFLFSLSWDSWAQTTLNKSLQ